MTTELKLSTDVTTHDTDRFIELPFDVPRGISKIQVKVSVTPGGEDPCTIDVGLCDPDRVRGWSGSTKYDLIVGVDEATPGYLKGNIPDGRWAILLGIYVVGKNGAHVETSVTLFETKNMWVKGDLHVHTVHSDGAYTLAELDSIAKRKGLDFIGLTDHNTTSQNFSYVTESPVTYIPAMELTTYHGHANLFGVSSPCDDFRVQQPSDLEQILIEAKKRGAKIAINHPYDDAGPSCQWQWGYRLQYDWVEVWNGPWRPSNSQSLELWQNMLSEGQRIVAVGGSDTHREHPYVKHGWPTTWVYTDTRSVAGILNGIQQGHAFLTYAPEGPKINIHCGEAMMGDVVTSDRTDDVVVTVEDLQKGDKVIVISDKGVSLSQTVCEEVTERKWCLDKGEVQFYRVEVWRDFPEANQPLMAALSNPIYFDRVQ
jgi:hypothetical protein